MGRGFHMSDLASDDGVGVAAGFEIGDLHAQAQGLVEIQAQRTRPRRRL